MGEENIKENREGEQYLKRFKVIKKMLDIMKKEGIDEKSQLKYLEEAKDWVGK